MKPIVRGYSYLGKNYLYVLAKSNKEHLEKYEPKLTTNGTFADVIKASVIPMPTGKKVPPKRISKKK